MPELPEMENYKTLLSQQILDIPITKVIINREKSINTDSSHFVNELMGRQVIFIERRDKRLIFHLDNGRRLLLHLMLGGAMYLGSEEDRPARSTQIEISFDGLTLYFIGLRLGYLHLISAKEVDEVLAELGPEPLDRRMNEQKFVEMFSKRRGVLKSALINQQIIAGIGNSYSDEIAYTASLRPSAKLQNCTEEDLKKLYHAIQLVLHEAIDAGGYMDIPLTEGDTLTGGYNAHFKVYEREGEPCLTCGAQILRTEIGGRKSFYCATCQHDQ